MLADLVETGAALYAAAFLDAPRLVWIMNVASYVRQLPESDPRFARLAAISSPNTDFPLPGDAVLEPFAAGQPHPTIADYDQLVEWLIDAAGRLRPRSA